MNTTLEGATNLLVHSELLASGGVITLPASALKLDPTFDLRLNIAVQTAATAVHGLVAVGATK